MNQGKSVLSLKTQIAKPNLSLSVLFHGNLFFGHSNREAAAAKSLCPDAPATSQTCRCAIAGHNYDILLEHCGFRFCGLSLGENI